MLLWSESRFLSEDTALPWIIHIKNAQPLKEDSRHLPRVQVALPYDLKRKTLSEYNRITVGFHYSYKNKNNSKEYFACIISFNPYKADTSTPV